MNFFNKIGDGHTGGPGWLGMEWPFCRWEKATIRNTDSSTLVVSLYIRTFDCFGASGHSPESSLLTNVAFSGNLRLSLCLQIESYFHKTVTYTLYSTYSFIYTTSHFSWATLFDNSYSKHKRNKNFNSNEKLKQVWFAWLLGNTFRKANKLHKLGSSTTHRNL